MECFIENLESCDFTAGNFLFFAFSYLVDHLSIYMSYTDRCHHNIFTKAGKPGWACLIPFMTTW